MGGPPGVAGSLPAAVAAAPWTAAATFGRHEPFAGGASVLGAGVSRVTSASGTSAAPEGLPVVGITRVASTLVAFSVLYTGDHWIIDMVAGAGYAYIAYYAVVHAAAPARLLAHGPLARLRSRRIPTFR